VQYIACNAIIACNKLHTSTNSFWATVCETVRPMLRDRCLCVLSLSDVGVLWPNGWMDYYATWYGGGHRPRPHCIRWGPSDPTLHPQKKRHTPNFSPMSVVAKRLDGLLNCMIILFIMTYDGIYVSASIVNIWSSLPNSVVDACSINAFKACLLVQPTTYNHTQFQYSSTQSVNCSV